MTPRRMKTEMAHRKPGGPPSASGVAVIVTGAVAVGDGAAVGVRVVAGSGVGVSVGTGVTVGSAVNPSPKQSPICSSASTVGL